jgi:putative phage-type endonuclease
MREILELEQRSEVWHIARKSSVGSSEVSAILGTNPWKSAYQLWEEKTGRRSGQFTNAAMQRGIDYEDEARACLEAQIGLTFTPKVFRRTDKTFLMASLDGITEDGSTLCEIKCPSTNGLREYAQKGEAPPYYFSQMDYQMLVSGAKEAVFFVWYSNEENYIVRITADENRQLEVETKVTEFWEKYIVTDTPPPLDKKDYFVLDNTAWISDASKYVDLKTRIRDLETQLKEVEDNLKRQFRLAGKSAVTGGGITVQEIERKGTVNTEAILAEYKIDAEKYRGKSTKYLKIGVKK